MTFLTSFVAAAKGDDNSRSLASKPEAETASLISKYTETGPPRKIILSSSLRSPLAIYIPAYLSDLVIAMTIYGSDVAIRLVRSLLRNSAKHNCEPIAKGGIDRLVLGLIRLDTARYSAAEAVRGNVAEYLPADASVYFLPYIIPTL